MRAQNNGACNALPCARRTVPRSASICGARRSIQPPCRVVDVVARARALSLCLFRAMRKTASAFCRCGAMMREQAKV